ncbi:hypothetical protein O6H91_10G069100 [Diphasiastrum complanatum]|uniref:Uncharacterized protein n=2 Tax=Diphasiastrum complanatum TaxID=34168 RepID=A0ACC2CI24_DIPCM|nr:hypothetical protein O6H91_10G069100 [Diphasiastrum complanatum]KAJ7541653.1 hypothetical protein O6H91_10G069100 [Diphasiastrum complanatum]
MPFNWNKSISKKTKQGCKDSDVVQSWLRPSGEGGWRPHHRVEGGSSWDSTRHSQEMAPDMRSSSPRLGSSLQSLSTPVSRTPSFTDPCKGQPLPLPCFPPGALAREALQPPDGEFPRQFVSLPLPSPNQLHFRAEAVELDGATSGYGSGSTSSVSSLSSADVPDQWTGRGVTRVSGFIPVTEGEMLNHGHPKNSTPLQTGSSSRQSRRGSKNDLSSTANPIKGSKLMAISPQRAYSGPSGIHHQQYQVSGTVPSSSAPSSSLSSPTLSPRRISSSEQSPSSGVAVSRSSQRSSELGMISSGQLSVQGSGQNSGHSSSTGDATLQMFWQQGKSSPEISPLPSPKKKTLGSQATIQVGTISPLHHRPSGFDLDSATNWLEDSRLAGHPLPLPPIPRSGSSPYASPSIPSSPTSRQVHGSARAESPMNPSTRWQKGKLLGCGTFGNVYKGFSDSGTFCAMKEVLLSDDPRSKESVRQLGQEIHMLSQLRHPNIVQYIGSETLEDRMYIYLEYVSGGSIHKLLQEYGQFKEPVIRSYTRQILQGLAYLHSMNKVHRDIKGANILVDTNGQVKLADFGMAKHINAHSIPLSFKGSPYWMAPEVIRNKNGYNCPVDIWSLGCTVIEMATAKPPWSQFEGIAAMFKIGNTLEIPRIPEFLSRDGQDFVRRCLRRNPAERPTAADLLEHAFVINAVYTVRPEETIDNFETTLPTTPGIHSLVPEHETSSSHDYASSGRLQSGTSEQSNWVHVRPASRSPSSSPRIQSTVTQNASSHFSPSPISTPLISSGTSTPQASGYGNSPFIATESKSELYRVLPPSYALDDSPRSGSFRSPQGDILGKALDRVRRDVENHFQKHHTEKWHRRTPS